MSNTASSIRGMKFTCDRTGESMTPTEGGRFCDSCQKPVIDFTDWRKEDLVAFFRRAPESCGQFTPEQVDPSLVPIEDLGKEARRGFFAAIAALSLNAANAQQAPSPPPQTEQVARTPGSDPKMDRGTDHITSNPRKGWEICPPDRIKAPKPKKRVRVYVSGRFPFLHVRGRTLRGRMRLTGCPVF